VSILIIVIFENLYFTR